MRLVCSAPWTGTFVWYDGTISHCGRTSSKGNLRDQTFREFWNSNRMREIRAMFLKDQFLDTGCPPTCNYLTAVEPGTYVQNYAMGRRERYHPVPGAHDTRVISESPSDFASNIDTVAREIEGGGAYVAGFPTSLTIQLFNYCALRCPMCCFGIIPPDQKKPTTRVLDEIVLDRLQEIYPYLQRVELLGGELFDIPFNRNPLVRVIGDMARLGSEHLRVEIVTNGQRLTEEWADFIVAHQFIDFVTFSVDSFEPDVYARVRTQGSLDRVRRSVTNLIDARRKTGANYPEVLLKSILSRHTCEGILSFEAESLALGAHRVEFNPLVEMGEPDFYEKYNLFQVQYADQLINVWRDLAIADGTTNRREVAGMVEAFLSHLGMREQAIATREDIPFAAQYGIDVPIGPICGPYEISQTFVAKRQRVRKAKLNLATYLRENTQDVEVAIEDEHGVVTSITYNPRQAQNNKWVLFDLPEANLEVDKEYRLVVRSPTSTGYNGVALRCAIEGSGLTFAGEACAGALAFMLF